MTLREFREQNALSLQRMADRVNSLSTGPEPVSASMIDRWEQGTIPRQENMRRIDRATGGQVTFADFYCENERRPKRKARAQGISVAASRKAAQTMRRQQASR